MGGLNIKSFTSVDYFWQNYAVIPCDSFIFYIPNFKSVT